MQIPYHLSKTNKKTHSLCKPKQKITSFANIKQMLPTQIKKALTNPLQMLNTYCIYKPKWFYKPFANQLDLLPLQITKEFTNFLPMINLYHLYQLKRNLIVASIIIDFIRFSNLKKTHIHKLQSHITSCIWKKKTLSLSKFTKLTTSTYQKRNQSIWKSQQHTTYAN